MEAGNLKQENALQFILGGNALFTVKYSKTGVRYTYKVLVERNDMESLRVYVMCGNDNTKDYKKIGYIKIQNTRPEYHPLSYTESLDSSVFFDNIFLNLLIGLYMPLLEIWHEGRCCRCGRTLTVPESIEMGIGPECIKQDSRVAI